MAFLIPSAAMADGITPLLMAGAFQLLVGNLFIGILEGYIIARVFKVRAVSSTGIMILANYFSSFAGLYILGRLGFYYGTAPDWVTIYNARTITWLLWPASFAITVVLEWPFCLWILSKRQHRLRASWKASLIAQTASYTILVLWFGLMVSHVQLNTSEIDRSLSFAHGDHATVYFLSQKDGNVYSVRLDGSRRTRVFVNPIRNSDTRLYMKASKSVGFYDLCVGTWNMTWHISPSEVHEHGRILISKAVRPDTDSLIGNGRPDESNPMDLRPRAASPPAIKGRDWYYMEAGFGGFSAGKEKGEHGIRIGVESPFMSWESGYVNVLPGNIVVFQLGHQILVVDVNRRKFGLLAVGRCPVVIPDR
jgi:hypothetical protein